MDWVSKAVFSTADMVLTICLAKGRHACLDYDAPGYRLRLLRVRRGIQGLEAAHSFFQIADAVCQVLMAGFFRCLDRGVEAAQPSPQTAFRGLLKIGINHRRLLGAASASLFEPAR